MTRIAEARLAIFLWVLALLLAVGSAVLMVLNLNATDKTDNQAAGISAETLRKIETGRIPTPAFFTVAALAVTLGLSLDALVGATGRPARDDPAA